MLKKVREKLSAILAPEPSGGLRGASSEEGGAELLGDHHYLRLLTFNIQVGISTSSYRHYLTKSWQHILPHSDRISNLDKIAHLLKRYDVVALQEADGGSIRSGFVNQVQYLAEAGGFPCWHQQLNRNLGRIAQHSNGLLSRYRPLAVEEYRLPGLIPGRGAIMARYGMESDPLVLVMMHLSLSAKAQCNQLAYIRDLVSEYRHVILMGDMNNHAEQLLTNTPLKEANLVPLPGVSHSFPSWRPEKSLDHIMVSPTLQIKKAGVVSFPVSDHLPIAMDVALPEGYLSNQS